MPKDRVSMNHQGYGFVEFLTEEDADYAIRVLNMIKMFGKPMDRWRGFLSVVGFGRQMG